MLGVLTESVETGDKYLGMTKAILQERLMRKMDGWMSHLKMIKLGVFDPSELQNWDGNSWSEEDVDETRMLC